MRQVKMPGQPYENVDIESVKFEEVDLTEYVKENNIGWGDSFSLERALEWIEEHGGIEPIGLNRIRRWLRMFPFNKMEGSD